MSMIEEANLLKLNREKLVEAINSLGFYDVDETTPMDTLAKCVKWATGLLDIRLATKNKRTGEYKTYSAEEYEQLSASDKSGRIKLGLQVRAEGQCFVLCKDHALRAGTGALTMPWAENNSNNVRGLTDYGVGGYGWHNEWDAERNTDLILAYGQEMGIRYEAAEQARAYKAATFADGGYDDPTKWSLPTLNHFWLMHKYRNQINDALTLFGFQAMVNDYYWTCIEFSSAVAYNFLWPSGHMNYSSKPSSSRVRPVAPVPRALAGEAI